MRMGGKVREAVDKACGGVLFVRLLGFVFKVKLFDKQCTAAFLRQGKRMKILKNSAE